MPELHPQEDDYPPLSALNDLLYCERRCALHRIEEVWVENAHTLSGTLSHKRADKPVEWKCESGREVHGMWLKSDRLRLVGKADVVEFHSVGQVSNLPAAEASSTVSEAGRLETCPTIPFPVEYKRGKRKKWDNDDVQLCAQAICLEEMLGVSVPREVVFTDKLRKKTEATAARLHELIASGVTPPAVLKPQCDGCSLRGVCLPELGNQAARVERYCRELFQV